MKNVLIFVGIGALLLFLAPMIGDLVHGGGSGRGSSGRHGIGEWHGASYDYGAKFERGYPLYEDKPRGGGWFGGGR